MHSKAARADQEAAGQSAQGFLATMLASRSPLTAQDAERIARDHFNLNAKAQPLTGERDENFQVVAEDGVRYVLKLSHPAEPLALIDLSTAAMRHVALAAPELSCPRVIADKNGDDIVAVADCAGTPRWARLLTWIEGRLLLATPPSARQRAACGRFCAQLALALRDFDHPAAERALIWDIAQFPSFFIVVSEAASPLLASEARRFMARYETEVAPLLPSLPRQVVHGDLNKRNVLFASEQGDAVSGVIDFGDVVKTCRACDLAVAAAANIVDRNSFRQDIQDVVRAYREVEPLTTLELRLVGPLIAMRLVMGILIPAWHRSRNPHSQHYAAYSDPSEERMVMADALLCEHPLD